MFGDLWRNDFLQATSKIGRWALRCLGLEPYSWALLSWGLKLRLEWREWDKMLDQVMEYTDAVGVELADMLVSINVRVLDQYMFGGNGLCQFMQDHQDCLEWLED